VATASARNGLICGRRLRVRGRGAPRTGGRGDLIVTVDVVVPPKLSPKARAAFQELAKALPEDPRAHLAAMVEDGV